jgi:hypothetical protein
MPEIAMQKPGEDCANCRARWVQKGRQVQKTEALPVRTEKRNIEVVVCPWCDGNTNGIAKLGNHVDPSPNYKPDPGDE